MAGVRAMLVREEGPEAALRNALSLVAEQGPETGVVVVLMSPGHLPQLLWSRVDQTAASMASVRVQMWAEAIMAEGLLSDDECGEDDFSSAS